MGGGADRHTQPCCAAELGWKVLVGGVATDHFGSGSLGMWWEGICWTMGQVGQKDASLGTRSIKQEAQFDFGGFGFQKEKGKMMEREE